MKRFTGIVVRTNNSKTAHVEVKSDWMHPKYKKKRTISHVFACNDTFGTKVGDEVEIVETRPISATKYFSVQSIVKAQAVIAIPKKTLKTKKRVLKKKTTVRKK